MDYNNEIVAKTKTALLQAGSTFLPDKKRAYERAIETESNPQAKWTLETILENAEVAEKNCSPLCDDTGIPHILLEVGPNANVNGTVIASIKEGVRQGLRALPGRPMAVKGNDAERLAQAIGLEEDSGALEPAPFSLREITEDTLRLNVLMFGGGPAIRGKTYRVFHRHSVENVLNEICDWASEATALLGCTPCTLAIGIGRSHYEAASLMLQALVDGTYDHQTEMEQEITNRVNSSGCGALGLGGNTTVLSTFLKVGPQRASGVRVVCLRPCCCFEPRIASVEL